MAYPGAPGYPSAGAPGYPSAGAPGYPSAGAPGYPSAGAPGYPSAGAPGYPSGGAPGYGGYGSPPQGTWFFIVCRMNGLVLDVEEKVAVRTWHRKGADFNDQLWYEDNASGTIRNRETNFCIDVEGDNVVVRPFQPGDPNQQWDITPDGNIRSRLRPDIVLEVADGRRDPGVRLVARPRHGRENQLFHCEAVGGAPGMGAPGVGAPGYGTPGAPAKRPFHIVSEMNGKVLDVERGGLGPGTNVVMFNRRPGAANQLFHMDQHGIIRSMLNDFAFEARAQGDLIRMMPFTGEPRQMWCLEHNRIINRHCPHECLDIMRKEQHDGAKVQAWQFKGKPNQHWRIDFV